MPANSAVAAVGVGAVPPRFSSLNIARLVCVADDACAWRTMRARAAVVWQPRATPAVLRALWGSKVLLVPRAPRQPRVRFEPLPDEICVRPVLR